jgi:hypothetical protein
MGARGPNCKICVHKDRHLIELALVHKLPLRVVARRFGVGLSSVYGHRANHMPPQLRAALLTASRPSSVDLEALERSESEGLLANLVGQRARLQLLSEMAFAEGEVQAATSVERAITTSLELTSKLLGMIIQRHDVRSTSILVSPDYLRLRQSLITALKPHPEAARAVSAALAELETEAAADIQTRKAPLMLEGSPC